MRHRWSVVLPLILVCLSMNSVAQLWNGVLAPARATDWSQAGAAIVNRQTVCATVSLATGSSAASANTSAIQTAISSCGKTGTPPAASDNVIMLPAGTFYINSFSISRSNFTLRGQGADQTLLIGTGISSGSNGGTILVTNGQSNFRDAPGNVVNWTAGYTQGTTNITISGYTNLRVGSMLILDQVDDNVITGDVDTGDIYVCGGTGNSIDPTCGDSPNTLDNGRPGRHQTQSVLVTSCGTSTSGAACTSGNVTISSGLYAPNWNRYPGQSLPQAWYGNALPTVGVGLENFSLNDAGLSGQSIVSFYNSANSWAKGLRLIGSTSTGQIITRFLTYMSVHITVRDSYMYGSTPSSGGYGLDFGFQSSDNLSENNICNHIAGCMVSEGTQGSVYAHNFAADNYYAGSWQQQDEDHHSVGDNYNLYEENIGSGIGIEKIHGGSFMMTVFRSRSSGRDPATSTATKTQSTVALNAYMFNRYVNAVGNVLGTAGYHTVYEWYPSSATDPGSASSGDHSVFALGWSGNEGTKGSNPNDLLVRSTLLRWGNWDDVNNAVRWQASENASAAPVYHGLSNPSQTLPPSFYLNSQPSWWAFPNGNANTPWPAIGPDVTSGNIANVGGHAYLTPAANCYFNVMGGLTDGTSGILTFNADNCYGSGSGGGTPPAPPSGLSAVVQ